MALEILYQDAAIVVVDKPAGMLVHPGREPEPRDQIAMKVLRDQLGQHIYPVHRLDRPTSGALLFVLDQEMVAPLRKQFDEQLVEKRYTAVVIGETQESWIAKENLQKEPGEPFRSAETQFSRKHLVSIGDDVFSVLTAEPKTGRFHQIRKHLLANGTLIVGDFLYGDIDLMTRIADKIDQPRLMLHAGELKFFHPESGKSILVKSKLPDRFAPFFDGPGAKV